VAVAIKDAAARPLDRLASSRRWTWWTALIGVAAGFLMATANPFQDLGSDQWTFIIDHSRGGLFEPDLPGKSREANLTFRVVPRIVGKVLQLSEPIHFLVVQAALGLVLLAVIARLFEEALGDRRTAIVGTLGTTGLWAVAASWIDLRGNFDAAALLLVLTAMLLRRWPLILLAGVAATFTDERAIFVLPLVAAWHLLRDEHPDGSTDGARPSLASLAWVPAIAAVAAAVAHLVLRTWLKQRYGLAEGQNRSPGDPWTQLNNYPNGWWGALEGYWLVALAGWLAMWRSGHRWLVAGTGLVVLATLIIGMSVFDISRSVSFVFPMVPIALLALRGVEARWREGLVWVAAAISLIWPLLYAADDRTVVWAYPLPLLLLDRLLNG
jgi:hypothetical protein